MKGNYILSLIKHVSVKNYDWKKCQFQYISSKKNLQTFIYDWIWYPINCLNFHSLKTILAAL